MNENLVFEQHYLDCLSQASYLIGDRSSGRAVVVDPRRDISAYLHSAAEHDLRIDTVLETHFHADFISGHLELAEATGAVIAFGDRAEPEFAHRKLADGERIGLGEVALEIRHTPGHTPESISIVVWEHAADPDTPGSVPFGVLTGDTMFIGDVGRPDLLASSGITSEQLGRMLHRSLHDRLLTLPDDTRVYPGHGAGSACGKSLSSETVSTIGAQRADNYALAPMDVEDFLALVTEGQPAAPGYFSHDATLNRVQRGLLDEDLPPSPMSIEDVLSALAGGAIVIDTRDQTAFSVGHLRGSVNVALGGRFSEYAGSVASPEDRIVIIAEPGSGGPAPAEPDGGEHSPVEHSAIEARTRLARIGFDNVIGHLPRPYGAMIAHPELTDRASRLTAEEFVRRRDDTPGLIVIDVRNQSETGSGTLEGSHVVPVARLRGELPNLADHKQAPIVTLCASGYRSSLAASLLRAAGFTDVSDVLGGYGALRHRGMAT